MEDDNRFNLIVRKYDNVICAGGAIKSGRSVRVCYIVYISILSTTINLFSAWKLKWVNKFYDIYLEIQSLTPNLEYWVINTTEI